MGRKRKRKRRRRDIRYSIPLDGHSELRITIRGNTTYYELIGDIRAVPILERWAACYQLRQWVRLCPEEIYEQLFQ